MECEELELAVKTGVWLGISLIIIAWGLDMSYSNFDVVSQPFCEESVFLSLANIQEKISKVAEDLFCVCDSVTSPLAFWAAQGYAAQANVGSRAEELVFACSLCSVLNCVPTIGQGSEMLSKINILSVVRSRLGLVWQLLA